jgi:hypothetical protein
VRRLRERREEVGARNRQIWQSLEAQSAELRQLTVSRAYVLKGPALFATDNDSLSVVFTRKMRARCGPRGGGGK